MRTCIASSLSRALCPRASQMVDAGHAERSQQGQERQRLQQRPGRHAARRHDDELAVAAEAVEHVNGGDQQGDRCDQRRHARDGKGGHCQEAQRILPLRGHQLELAQRHRDPDHARQGHEDEQERTGSLPKHVSAQDAHRVPRHR